LTKDWNHRYNYLCLFGVIPMLLHLRELYGKERSVRLAGSLDVSGWVEGHPDIRSAGTFEAVAEATGLPDERVRVSGSMDGRLELVCSRCLDVFSRRHAFAFTEMFAHGKPADDEDAEEDSVNYVTADRIDLTPYFEEHFWLEMPQFPLCDEDCRGLCPSCGKNRNTESCNCAEEATDHRWDGLKELKDLFS